MGTEREENIRQTEAQQQANAAENARQIAALEEAVLLAATNIARTMPSETPAETKVAFLDEFGLATQADGSISRKVEQGSNVSGFNGQTAFETANSTNPQVVALQTARTDLQTKREELGVEPASQVQTDQQKIKEVLAAQARVRKAAIAVAGGIDNILDDGKAQNRFLSQFGLKAKGAKVQAKFLTQQNNASGFHEETKVERDHPNDPRVKELQTARADLAAITRANFDEPDRKANNNAGKWVKRGLNIAAGLGFVAALLFPPLAVLFAAVSLVAIGMRAHDAVNNKYSNLAKASCAKNDNWFSELFKDSNERKLDFNLDTYKDTRAVEQVEEARKAARQGVGNIKPNADPLKKPSKPLTAKEQQAQDRAAQLRAEAPERQRQMKAEVDARIAAQKAKQQNTPAQPPTPQQQAELDKLQEKHIAQSRKLESRLNQGNTVTQSSMYPVEQREQLAASQTQERSKMIARHQSETRTVAAETQQPERAQGLDRSPNDTPSVVGQNREVSALQRRKARRDQANPQEPRDVERKHITRQEDLSSPVIEKMRNDRMRQDTPVAGDTPAVSSAEAFHNANTALDKHTEAQEQQSTTTPAANPQADNDSTTPGSRRG